MAITLELNRPVTDNDLLTLSERNPGYPFERLAKGELIVSPTGSQAGLRSGEVFAQLYLWNRSAGVGRVFDASTGWQLADGSCLSPDASWVPSERWAALSKAAQTGVAPLCPDAVFEVRSPSTWLAELRAKMAVSVGNGARVVVLVDPPSETVEVHRPGQRPMRIEHPATVALGGAGPGVFPASYWIFRPSGPARRRARDQMVVPAVARFAANPDIPPCVPPLPQDRPQGRGPLLATLVRVPHGRESRCASRGQTPVPLLHRPARPMPPGHAVQPGHMRNQPPK